MPQLLAFAVANWCLIAGKPGVAAAVLLCFAGLLRVSEALALTARDVHFVDGKLILVLNETKRGVHQKIVLSDPSLLRWFAFYDRHARTADDMCRYVPISYNVFTRWFRKAALQLGSEIEWSSHSLRRGGATELQRRQVPLPDIMLAGRWASSRSAREYLRKGDVALLRHEANMNTEYRLRLERFAGMAECAWGLVDLKS